VANRIANIVVPITSVTTFDPETEAESSSVYFFFSKRKDQSEDPAIPGIVDGSDPIQ
jgi:hypothetical protein